MRGLLEPSVRTLVFIPSEMGSYGTVWKRPLVFPV